MVITSLFNQAIIFVLTVGLLSSSIPKYNASKYI